MMMMMIMMMMMMIMIMMMIVIMMMIMMIMIMIMMALLFLIYIKDLSRTSDQFHFVLIADDTNAFMFDKSISSLFERANQELIIITAWLIAN